VTAFDRFDCTNHAPNDKNNSSTYRPKVDEIFERRHGNIETVQESVTQEQHKKLVVGEAYAVIHPEIHTFSLSKNLIDDL
jgi:hypothetical protein